MPFSTNEKSQVCVGITKKCTPPVCVHFTNYTLHVPNRSHSTRDHVCARTPENKHELLALLRSRPADRKEPLLEPGVQNLLEDYILELRGLHRGPVLASAPRVRRGSVQDCVHTGRGVAVLDNDSQNVHLPESPDQNTRGPHTGDRKR